MEDLADRRTVSERSDVVALSERTLMRLVVAETGMTFSRWRQQFPPASAVDADPELGRERAVADLAVDGGSGQAGTGKDRFEPDDAVWFAHGGAASCWLFMIQTEQRFIVVQEILAVVVLWRRDGGK